MKAIQIKQPGTPEAMEFVDLPVPEPEPNEVVVKISAAGVNFIDVYNREGRYKVAAPFVLGQEGAGVVTAAGKDVKSVKPGDRVAYTGVMGSYSEYSAVPADRLVKVPKGVDDRQAAAAMLQGMTAHYLWRTTSGRGSSEPYPPIARPNSRAKLAPMRSSFTRRLTSKPRPNV